VSQSIHVAWPRLIDGVLLAKLVDYASGNRGDVDAMFLTGSYTRGSWNRARPNVNVYFIALPGRAAAVRVALGRVLSDTRGELRDQGVDLAIDCHPYTISQRDPEWRDRPLLTLTTKVFAGENVGERYHVSPTIGLGWFTTHKVLVGRADALSMFGQPPTRDESWLHGAHQALSHYRNILDHLPWALDSQEAPARLLEESCRYAEEALRDGVHIGLTAAQLVAGRNIEILHDWAQVGRSFYHDRYGEEGAIACDIVDRMKAQVANPRCDPEAAEQTCLDALRVWNVVWEGYRTLAIRMDAGPELLRVTAWL
jgi:hypothetical protein